MTFLTCATCHLGAKEGVSQVRSQESFNMIVDSVFKFLCLDFSCVHVKFESLTESKLEPKNVCKQYYPQN